MVARASEGKGFWGGRDDVHCVYVYSLGRVFIPLNNRIQYLNIITESMGRGDEEEEQHADGPLRLIYHTRKSIVSLKYGENVDSWVSFFVGWLVAMAGRKKKTRVFCSLRQVYRGVIYCEKFSREGGRCVFLRKKYQRNRPESLVVMVWSFVKIRITYAPVLDEVNGEKNDCEGWMRILCSRTDRFLLRLRMNYPGFEFSASSAKNQRRSSVAR